MLCYFSCVIREEEENMIVMQCNIKPLLLVDRWRYIKFFYVHTIVFQSKSKNLTICIQLDISIILAPEKYKKANVSKDLNYNLSAE